MIAVCQNKKTVEDDHPYRYMIFPSDVVVDKTYPEAKIHAQQKDGDVACWPIIKTLDKDIFEIISSMSALE